jgi:hypothetical protein
VSVELSHADIFLQFLVAIFQAVALGGSFEASDFVSLWFISFSFGLFGPQWTLEEHDVARGLKNSLHIVYMWIIKDKQN